MDGHPALIKRQIAKIKPKLFSAQLITASLPITLHKPSHCHEFAYVVSGSGKLITEKNMYDFSQDNIIVLDKNIQRGVFFDTEQGEIISLTISFKTDKPITQGDVSILQSDKFSLSTKKLFEAMLIEFSHRSFVSKYLNEGVLKAILLSVLRSSVPEGAFSNKSRIFLHAKAYFDENFLTIENIELACKTLDINKFFLTHLFNENLGLPPVKYLINKRMDMAKTILRETNISIGAVAKECGYDDVAYFCRIFKKTVGTTPLKYRRCGDKQ